jgi:hypothetical protein
MRMLSLIAADREERAIAESRFTGFFFIFGVELTFGKTTYLLLGGSCTS